MTQIGDDRTGFYFENRQQIDEWARLKDEAVDAVVAVFRQLHEELDGVASGLHGTPLLMPFLDGPWPAYALVDRRWPAPEPGLRVLAGVTLEMDRRGLLSGPSVPNIFVGIRIEKSLSGGPELHGAILQEVTAQSSYGNRPTAWWPCWRHVPMASERWWEDRQAFESALVGGLVKAWVDLAPTVSPALERLNLLPSD